MAGEGVGCQERDEAFRTIPGTTGTHVLLLHTNTSGKKEKVFYQSLVEFFIHAIHVHYSRNSPFTMIHCVTATPVYCSTPLIDHLGLLFGTRVIDLLLLLLC